LLTADQRLRLMCDVAEGVRIMSSDAHSHSAHASLVPPSLRYSSCTSTGWAPSCTATSSRPTCW
jgi:hypothetical protein